MKLSQRLLTLWLAFLLPALLLLICFYTQARPAFEKQSFRGLVQESLAKKDSCEGLYQHFLHQGADFRVFLLEDGVLLRALPENAPLLWEPALLQVEMRRSALATSKARCLCYCTTFGTQTLCVQADALPLPLQSRANRNAIVCSLFLFFLACTAFFALLFEQLAKPLQTLCAKLPCPPASDELSALTLGFTLKETQVLEATEQARAAAAHTLHELRAPLCALRAIAETMQRYPDAARRFSSDALSETERMSRLLSDCPMLAQGALPLNQKPICLKTLLTQTLRTFRPAAREAGVRLKISTTLPGTINADEDRIRQVLWNLLENAVNALRPSGTIAIAMLETKQNEKQLLGFSVTSLGTTVPETLLHHLCDRFVSTKGKSGLGLALCQEIVRTHNGLLRFENVNSSFCVSVLLEKCPK